MAQAKTDHVILGCTDLQLLWTAKDSVIDSLHLLAQDTARLAGATV